MRNILKIACLLLCIAAVSDLHAVTMGADQMDQILPKVKGLRVGVVVNHSSRLSQSGLHLLDTLLNSKVNVRRIYTPEHGFRGDADAGEKVANGVDPQSGLPIISLYGSSRKPSAEQLEGVDALVFDIQDVGARFYTYISTLLYIMQSCSELRPDMQIIVLDRPNPCDYVAGPIVTESRRSFVGALPIPILHGLTMCELAEMINGEGWAGDKPLNLSTIRMRGWRHGDHYSLPIKPSPNLPTDQSIALYPSLCLFEATIMSVGRGTTHPFEVVGYPDKRYGSFSFTPQPLAGFDKNPMYSGERCYGVDLRNVEPPKGLSLKYLIDMLQCCEDREEFFSRAKFFDMLVGTDRVRLMLCEGCSEEEIRATWSAEVDEYKTMRAKYLLYDDYKKER